MRKAAHIVPTKTNGSIGKNSDGGRVAPVHEEIAQVAFSLYESRGRQDGHDFEDWLLAEQSLVIRES
jgi:hypothetical protein